MSHPGPQAQSRLDAAAEICRLMIRRVLARAVARNRRLNLIFLSAMTVFFLVTMVASALWMSK